MLKKIAQAFSALIVPALLSCSVASAQATLPFGVRLPSDYFGRFGSIEAVASNTDGYGFRYLPLPFEPDIRLTLLKAPTYLDYGLSTRYKDTTILGGVFYNVGKAQAIHDPWTGLQFGVYTELPDVWRKGRTYDPFSKAYVGYAYAPPEGHAWVLNNFGVAAKTTRDDTTFEVKDTLYAPYWQSIASAWTSKTVDPAVTVRINATARLYAYPLQGMAQGSLDLTPGVEFRPAPGLSMDFSHLERFAVGEVPMGDSYGRYQESYANITYRLKPNGDPELGLGAVRGRVTRTWTSDYTYVYGDIFLRTRYLPTMLGPSVGYRFGPNGTDSMWLFSLVALGK